MVEECFDEITTSFNRYDIFMLCWDDGRNGTHEPTHSKQVDELVDLFREKNHEIGNVRWIFFTWESVMRAVSCRTSIENKYSWVVSVGAWNRESRSQLKA